MVSRGLHAYYSVHFAKKKRDQLVSAGFATELSVANDATEKNLQAQLDVVSWPCFIYIFKCALKPWACTCHTPLWQQWTDWSHFAYSCTQWQSLLDQKHRKNQNKSPTSAGPIQPPPTSVSSSVPPKFFLWLPLCQSKRHMHLPQLVYPFNRLILCCHMWPNFRKPTLWPQLRVLSYEH